jgi:hypothetical protein
MTTRLMVGGDDQVEQWHPPKASDLLDPSSAWHKYAVLADDLEQQESWLHNLLHDLNAAATDMATLTRF